LANPRLRGYLSLMTIVKTSLRALLAWIRGAIRARVPLGYQDEAGFHTGVPHTASAEE
jgi:hypothetical protein